MLYKGHEKIAAPVAFTTLSISLYCTEQTLSPLDFIIAAGIVCSTSLFTACIPDLDSSTSRISRKIPIVNIMKSSFMLIIGLIMLLYFPKTEYMEYSKYGVIPIGIFCFANLFLSHRKILHSLWLLEPFILILDKFSPTFIPYYIAFGLMCGIIAHFVGDCFTTDGCYLLFPIPIRFRIACFKSGEDDDKVCSIIYFLCILILAALHILQIQ